jgi:hypothetical protein
VVGALHAMREAEQLMTQTSSWMEENFEHWRVQWNGRLVRSIWARAQPLMHGRKDCTKCGAELTGRTVFHMSESVTCKHCGAVNAVSPDPLVYTYFAMAPDMIADEATIATKLGLERARSSGASQAQMIELTPPALAGLRHGPGSDRSDEPRGAGSIRRVPRVVSAPVGMSAALARWTLGELRSAQAATSKSMALWKAP